MTGYLLGVDLGAGSLKAAVVDFGGRVVGVGSCPVTTLVPREGWSEQDPVEWVVALGRAVRGAVGAAGVAVGEVVGVGVSAGAHIPVLVGVDGVPLRPAIMWSDQRSVVEAAVLHERAGDLIIRASLNRVNPTWTLAMLAWLRRHEPGVVAKVKRLFLAKDYLRFCLTGTWETDFSDVVGALMGDDVAKGWSAEICGLIGWDMATLPPIVRPQRVVGGVTAAGAALTGLVVGTPVVCGSNDTTVEFFGVGAVVAGVGAVKLATAGVLYLATAGPSVNPPISCYPHIIEGMYYTATGTNSCASAHRWVRDLMFGEGGFEEMDDLAGGVAVGCGGLMFHPYLRGERAPYWDPLLRGDFLGLTIGHGRAHFARAVYEGIAFSIRDILEAARGLGQCYGVLRLMGGGSRSVVWRQIIADVTGLVVEVMEASDASFGAALVAGLGVGVFAGPLEAVARCVRRVGVCLPDKANHEVYSEAFLIYKEAQAALAPLSHRLGSIAPRS